jgi:tRNA pseudouridine55 synthase
MNGVLIIDKPEGLTSHDVIYKVRKILKIKAVGHTGTLDPFATGVLVVLVGRATRLAQFLDKAEKEYLATIQFGFETDTGDRTGVRRGDAVTLKHRDFSDEEIEKALAKFRGDVLQTPPMYSAKKIAGKKLYELARKGIEIERQPVQIKISELEIVEDQGPKTRDQMTIRILCSAGTYIRVLAENIGKELETGAHLTELRRTRAGNFDLSQAVTLEKLSELANENNIEQILFSPKMALNHLPSITLDEKSVGKTINGNKFHANGLQFVNDQFVRMCDEQENLIAVGIFNEQEKSIRPRVVLAIN